MANGALAINGQKLSGVAEPEASDDGATKSYADTKAALSHTHAQADVTNLVSDLAAKAASNHTHAGLPVLFRVTADVAQNSNSTFSNLFTQAVLAGEVWSFEAILYFSSAATTTGIVTQLDSPAFANAQISMLTLESATTLRSLPASANATLTGTAALTTVLEARVSGTVEVSANGNLVLKFRSEVNGSAITVKRGSWARFYKHS